MKKKKNSVSMNYLDYIPAKQNGLKWHTDENGLITLEVENKGIFHTIAQKLLKKPRYTQVHMEEQGSFLWPLIDGKRNIHDLALLQKETFGDAVEPLYPRIIQYFRTMESYHFITFTNKK